MTKPLDPSTPQFKTALIRKLKNIAPNLEVDFCEAKRGVAFRLVSSGGRYRSKVVTIFVNRGDALTRSKLERLLRSAGYSAEARR